MSHSGSTDSYEAFLLTLYGRRYCHLCDDMIAALQPLQSRFNFEVQVVDVDSSPELEQRYGEKVPVLVLGTEELCHYFLDTKTVTAALEKIR